MLARLVSGVADTLPAHAVPLPRADHRAVVPPAAALQLLAALAFSVALAVLPCVSRIAAAARGEEQAWVSGHGACTGPRPLQKQSKSGTASPKTNGSTLVLTPCWSRVADWEQTSEMLFFHQSYSQHQINAQK